MKSIKNLVYLFFLLSCIAHAAPECLDNSHHGAIKYDSGSYYLVTDSEHGPCYCPCGSKNHTILWGAQGKCMQCGHYRVPNLTNLMVKKRKMRRPNPNTIINIKKLAAYKRKK
jgi:hypothetical protein